MNTFTVDQLEVRQFPNRSAMGAAAADRVRGIILQAQQARGIARVIFACAPSQNEFLAALVSAGNVDWAHVEVFHMDEYVGLRADQPQSFRNYLKTHLLDLISPPKAFHPIRGEARSVEDECARYAALLNDRPMDLVCLGIGENGHLAFNDPPVADFSDPKTVKAVELDLSCRQQQVNDGCFANLDAVPTHALTLTIPALFGARTVSGVVPGSRKADAVRATLRDVISTACPATILRQHSNAVLHIDNAASEKLT